MYVLMYILSVMTVISDVETYLTVIFFITVCLLLVNLFLIDCCHIFQVPPRSERIMRYEKYYRQIGLNIAYYRKLRGMSQMALAEATDLSRTHISNIEAPNMKTSLSLESLFDIAGVLQVAPRALLDFRDEKPQDFHE